VSRTAAGSGRRGRGAGGRGRREPGPLLGAELELEVGPIAHGGACVARHEGRVVFVRHTLPGERVRARVTEDAGGSFVRADALEVLRASPDRVERPCEQSGPGRCGGCDFQHVAVPAQRRLKAAVVREQLSRLAGIDLPVTVEALPGPGERDGLGWRTRMGYAVRPDGVVGLHEHRSDDVYALSHCPIAAPAVEELGVLTRRWPGLASVEVEAGARGRLVVLTPRGRRRPDVPPLDDPMGDSVGVAVRDPGTGAVRRTALPHGVVEEVTGRRFEVSAGGFWQVHPSAGPVLVEAVLSGLAPRPGERVLDLYSGAGLFTAPLAVAVGEHGRVWAVEADARACADAARNTAHLPQVRVQTARVDAALLDAPWAARPDLVVLDPPRAGAGLAVTRRLAASGARAVAYVACDPASLARDVGEFRAQGWRVASLRAFDLFPMTAHVECVAVLAPGSPG
jgi:tRNA/tmRNA/rRNA uracil-C5-methylase (TrmA/RlmC/RlmD family)